jgi:hypothetical protein
VQGFYLELTEILQKMDQTVNILRDSLETQSSKSVKDK